MSASVRFKDIEVMLRECAPGSTWRLAKHSRVVMFNSKTYRSMPKYDNIELGHVRKMIHYLGIDEKCAKKHLPTLFGKD